MNPAMMVRDGNVRILRDKVLVGPGGDVATMTIAWVTPVDDDYAVAINGVMVIDQRRFSSAFSSEEVIANGQLTKVHLLWDAGVFVSNSVSPWVQDPAVPAVPITMKAGDIVEIFAVNVNATGWKTGKWSARIALAGGVSITITGGTTDSGTEGTSGPFNPPRYRSLGSFRIPS